MTQPQCTVICPHCGIRPVGKTSKTGYCRNCAISIAKSGIHGRDAEGPNPSGLCMCGCGQPAPIARWNRTSKGEIAGKPVRFLPRHASRLSRVHAAGVIPEPNPSGMCLCGCGQPAPIAKQSHTERGWVAGKPMRYLPGHNTAIRDYTVNSETGCWEWRGQPNADGYGTTHFNGRKIPAHCYMYERLVGPIPHGMVLDHTCRNRRCVNPAHLEPVTHTENVRRGLSAIIDVATARTIKQMLPTMGDTAIARELGVTRDVVKDIRRGRNWRDA